MSKKIISASILSANFADLGNDSMAALKAGVDAIHFDVMDHHFVPNLSFGAIPCKALRDFGINAEIDVHLMVDEPENYIEPFAKAGASRLTFHPETVKDPAVVLDKIRQAGMEAGLAFNPDKPIAISDELLASLDLILIMSVFPGFGGQSFIEETKEKMRETRQRLDRMNAKTHLAVDGGVKASNIGEIAETGATYFVVGSGLFSADDYNERVQQLRDALK